MQEGNKKDTKNLADLTIQRDRIKKRQQEETGEKSKAIDELCKITRRIWKAEKGGNIIFM